MMLDQIIAVMHRAILKGQADAAAMAARRAFRELVRLGLDVTEQSGVQTVGHSTIVSCDFTPHVETAPNVH